jgi:hypothetical protein
VEYSDHHDGVIQCDVTDLDTLDVSTIAFML